MKNLGKNFFLNLDQEHLIMEALTNLSFISFEQEKELGSIAVG